MFRSLCSPEQTAEVWFDSDKWLDPSNLGIVVSAPAFVKIDFMRVFLPENTYGVSPNQYSDFKWLGTSMISEHVTIFDTFIIKHYS